jgi:hypothetical protein
MAIRPCDPLWEVLVSGGKRRLRLYPTLEGDVKMSDHFVGEVVSSPLLFVDDIVMQADVARRGC